ncbi:hypothetical protein R1sor_021819 [Riccia sorocarpa]|uniref:Protein kinase domain-containing protein n=1 Tax=Riccia sorocarpa TaxID=122646 RepID=A0ABD3GIV1_9MARC
MWQMDILMLLIVLHELCPGLWNSPALEMEKPDNAQGILVFVMWKGVAENISMRPGRRAKAAEAHTGKSGEIKVPTGTGKAGVLREFSRKFSDSNVFTSHLQDWLHEKLEHYEEDEESTPFPLPFQLEELRQLDYALEGVLFQQLLRMPPAASGPPSAVVQPDTYLAVEDWLHVSAESLWETFWSTDDSMPFYVSGPRSSSKIHSVEKASGRGRISTLPGVALIARNGSGGYVMWDHIAQFVEVKSQVAIPNQSGRGYVLTPESLGCAIFHGLLMLLNRASSDKKTAHRKCIDTAYILVLDSKYGGVLKLKGDVSKLEMNLDAVYTSAAEWVLKHADICLSSIEIVWNNLGNPNWGDLGTLQLLMAVFQCIEQFRGAPRRSIAELAAEHNGRVQRRKSERRTLEVQENGSDPAQQHHSHRRSHREIVEIEEEEGADGGKSPEHMKLEPGTMLWLEDAHWQRGFQIHEDLGGGRRSVYAATSLDDVGQPLAVYVGAHPSQLEPSWEDMSMWYQVQRQTRVLNIMKQRGISSKYLPQLIASGRLMHPGPCTKKSPGGRCDHPWCGTPVLVTSPVGESLDIVIEREGFFSSEEALRCCHDILSALRSSSSAGIQHGDINPEHVIRVNGADGEFYYVLVDWGRAVLEDRDSPAIAPRFSSTTALQEGKLCPASDAESLVYLLYFICGGKTPEFDTMEAALQWRERVWARRAIQQQLGEVSAVLKAFADYVDSLCGTPYPVDYDIWLRRLSRALHHDDPGKKIEYPTTSARLDYVAESSGASGASVD